MSYGILNSFLRMRTMFIFILLFTNFMSAALNKQLRLQFLLEVHRVQKSSNLRFPSTCIGYIRYMLYCYFRAILFQNQPLLQGAT